MPSTAISDINEMIVLSYLNKFETSYKELTYKIRALTGWKRYGLAMFAGIFATLSMAPYYILPLLVIGYTILLLLIDPESEGQPSQSRRGKWRTFATGWWFGFGYFLSGLYWMGFAFLVRADEFAWMLPIAIPAFAGFLAIFMAGPALGYIYLKKNLQHRRTATVGLESQKATLVKLQNFMISKVDERIMAALIFAFCFSISEYLRGHILTGLPWNLTGQATLGILAVAQSASFYGVYGLSFVLLFLCALPIQKREAIENKNKSESKALNQLSFLKPSKLSGWSLSLIGFLVLFAAGQIRLITSPTFYHDDISISIIQPNIKQKDKHDPNKAASNFEKLIAVSVESEIEKSEQNNKTKTRYMIWPENAVAWLGEQPYVLEQVHNSIQQETILITGTIRSAPRIVQSSEKQSSRFDIFNTVAVVETAPGIDGAPSSRQISTYYDKHHLVPFGEYLPLKNLLKALGLSQLAPVEDGFKPGIGPQTLAIGPASFAPLICYETIFPGAIYPRGARPQWMVTVTNDAWFGDNAGPKQHLDQARLRSIENGLPMARSANTGISSLIDAHGRILNKVELYQDGFINTHLPRASAPTLYSRWGDSFFAMMIFFTGLIITLHLYARRR